MSRCEKCLCWRLADNICQKLNRETDRDFFCGYWRPRVAIKILNINGERFKISGHDLMIMAEKSNDKQYTLETGALAYFGGDWRDMEEFT